MFCGILSAGEGFLAARGSSRVPGTSDYLGPSEAFPQSSRIILDVLLSYQLHYQAKLTIAIPPKETLSALQYRVGFPVSFARINEKSRMF